MASEAELWHVYGQEIREHPERDEPRIRFATVLDPIGERKLGSDAIDPRAELIFSQLRLARMSPDHPEWFRLAIRIRSLLITYQKFWTPKRIAEPGITGVEFHRGFVAKITVPARVLADRVTALFEDAPIQHLDLVGIKDDDDYALAFSALESEGVLGQIRSLRLDSQRIANTASLRMSSWTGLRWLSLRYNKIDARNAGILFEEAPPLLRSIDLYGNEGDTAQRLQFDQGVLIATEPAKEGMRRPDRRAERHVHHGVEVYADRFASDAE